MFGPPQEASVCVLTLLLLVSSDKPPFILSAFIPMVLIGDDIIICDNYLVSLDDHDYSEHVIAPIGLGHPCTQRVICNHQNCYLSWLFPPVWGVADNTKETTKTMGIPLRSSSNDEGPSRVWK